MNKEQCIARCITIMVEKRTGPHETARVLIADPLIDRSLLVEFAVVGLAHEAARTFANHRVRPEPSRGDKTRARDETRRMTRTIGKTIEDHAKAVLTKILLVVDGKMKALLDFTKEDLGKWGLKGQSKARSWAARARWCALAGQALTRTGAKTLGALPPKDRRAVAIAAEKTWRRPAGVSRKKANARAA